MKKSYHLELNSHEGYLTLTDERIIFIRANGFFKKSYNKKLDLQYKKIKNIINKSPISFDLIEKNDKKHSFSTFGVPSTIIVNAIKYYQEYSDSFDTINAQAISSHVKSEGDK
jgi:hypothetical protein